LSAQCTDCRRPLGDQAFYCNDCLDNLSQIIGDMPSLLAELEVTATRQSVIGSGDGGRKSAETALPFNVNAAELLATARNTLTTWVRDASESGCTVPLVTMLDERALSLYLIRALPWFRTRPEVTQLMDELAWLRSNVLQAIDRAAPLWFAGPCDECGADLYCKPDAAEVKCETKDCDLIYDVSARRRWLLAVAEDSLATATVTARALTSLGEPVTPSMIRNLAARNQIYPHSVDRDGNPLYKIGEVISALWRRRTSPKRQRKVKISA
jgi:hypothetical protein